MVQNYSTKQHYLLDANTANERYSYFSMDAGVGQTRGDFWLFGGTGDYLTLAVPLGIRIIFCME